MGAATHLQQALRFTKFDALDKPRGKLADGAWSDLGNILRTPKPRPSDPNRPKLPGYSLAVFRDAYRDLEHVEAVTAIGLDLDEGSSSLDDVRRALAAAALAAYIHTTKSSTPAAPCFRAVVPFSRPVTVEEYGLVWPHVRDWLLSEHGLVLDEKTKDASRFWFVPCEPAEGSYVFVELEGHPLDVDAVIAEARHHERGAQERRRGEADAPQSTTSARGGDEPDALARIPMSTRKKRAAAYVARREPAVSGEGGHNAAMGTATAIVRGFALDEVSALEVLSAWNDRCEPPWSRAELVHKVREADRVGSMPLGAKLFDTVADRDERTAQRLPRYRIWSPEEIYAPIAPPVYVIEPLLRRANLALVVAFGSSLKTWKMIAATTSIATGQSFLERFACPNPGPVLIVDWESGDEELRRRLQADARARGLDGPVPNVAFVTMPELFFTSKDFESELEKLAEGRAAIFFDSLAAGSVDVEENDARFAQGLQICKRVATRTGTSFVVLHHARKDGGEDADERQSVRGTGAIFAAADVVLSLKRPRKGVEDSFIVRQTKSRGSKRVDPFLLRVEDLPNGGVRTYATDIDEAAEASADDIDAAAGAFARAKRAILYLLGSQRDLSSANAVCRRVKGTKSTKLDALRELQEDGLVVVHDGSFRLASEVQP